MPKAVALNKTHLTEFSRLLTRHDFRRGLVDHKTSITMLIGRENSAFGGPNPSIDVVASLARYTASRHEPRLAE
jgi:hypothetical protein